MTRSIDVRNPRTGEIDYRIEPPDFQELNDAAAKMRMAQPEWEAQGLGGRASALMKWRDALAERQAAIVAALIHDTGRRTESELEVGVILSSIERWCGLGKQLLAEEPQRPSSIPVVGIRQAHRPYQLAGVISPWNFPLLLSLIDSIPALVAGCAVLIKPSEVAPRFIEPVMQSIAAVPEVAGILSYVAGDGETGRAIIDLVDVVCFTGSVPTGKLVAEQAARRFIPAFLELGGKDPAIVLASADIDRATSALLWGSTANAGQACQSIERIYVDERILDDFVSTLSTKAKQIELAAPAPESGQIGPIIAADQIDVIEEHLADAKKKGARVHCGGEILKIDGGSYCPPTVLSDVNHSMKVMTEETFGPIMPVMAFENADEAVELANDTVYGLSAAVFAGTAEEAVGVARRINAGAVSINDAALTALVYDAEKNSFNLSGLGGSRMGPAALRRFGRRQAFLISESEAPDPWWYAPLKES